MATTWIKPLHIRKDRTILQSITERTDYAMNQDKMEGGVPVIGYACDPRSVDAVCYKGWFRITATNYSMATAHP